MKANSRLLEYQFQPEPRKSEKGERGKFFALHKKFKSENPEKKQFFSESEKIAGKIKFQVGIILTFIIGKYCTNGCEWLSKIAVFYVSYCI